MFEFYTLTTDTHRNQLHINYRETNSTQKYCFVLNYEWIDKLILLTALKLTGLYYISI